MALAIFISVDYSVIQAHRNKSELQVLGVGNLTYTYTRGKAVVHLSSNTDQQFGINITMHIIESITSPTPASNITEDCWHHLRNLQLADPTFGETGRIDALLGSDVWGQIIEEGVVRGGDGEPFAQATKLGWVVFGPATINTNNLTSVRTLAGCLISEEQRVDDLLCALFEVDDAEQVSTTTFEAELCERLFMDTHTRNSDGRYCVQIPFKPDASKLGNSHCLALRQFHQLERKLASNQDLQRKYVSFMREYIELGHMHPIQEQHFGEPSKSYFIPHHAVTTKFRVVFNASAQTSTGISLNETQLAGPLIQDLLVNIIFRFRRFAVALSADIEKMFRQVLIDQRHRKWQRILWRESPTEPLQTYQLATVTYGTASGSFLAIRTMQQCALDNSNKLPNVTRAAKAQKSILRDFYVDDYLNSLPSAQEAIELARDIGSVLSQGCFRLHKWQSNDRETMAQLTMTPVRNEIELPIETTVLGLHWDASTDELFYKIKLSIDAPSTTKRQVLSDISRLYDPTGLLAPVLIVAKIFVQRLWKEGLNWDASLPQQLLDEWTALRKSLRRLEDIRIPRWLGMSTVSTPHLYGFCDASKKAYAAAIYISTIQKDGTHRTMLITSKTKVATIKAITIPRLELCAAHLLTTTMMNIRQALELNDTPYTLWTDSSIVLSWLRKSPSQLKPYVANRISYIHQHSDIASWHHIRTQSNPADCASRGISVDALITHQLWWNGPAFDIEPDSNDGLKLSEEENLIMETEFKPVKANITRTTKTLNIETYYKKESDLIIINLLERYSKIGKLLRTTAYVLRWKKSHRRYRSQSIVNADEMEQALHWHILAEQHQYFGPDIIQLEKGNCLATTSKLATLCPYIDTSMNNLLRSSGRLENARLNEYCKHPIILPKESRLAWLIVNQAHQDTLHGGIQLMLQTIREKYWILHLRTLVKQCIHSCSICRRHQHTMAKQRMASLPRSRVLASPPFSVSGLDYCGPFNIRIGSKHVRTVKKTYVAIFICMASKAVHIELAEDLTAEAFINLYTRFVNRRGPCYHLYSDNGTTFVGANRILQEDLKEWHKTHTLQHLANKGTQWHFIPPRAPHQGGLWEAAVKSAKRHLQRVVGTQSIYYDQLHTLLVHIEACLNSRPLVAIHDDIDDRMALTPADLLIGRSIVAVPDKPVLNIPTERLSYWRRLRQMQQHFWRRWQNEYLSTLHQRSKWHNATDDIKIGDVVIIRNENLPATQWRLGRIIELHPGDDGLTRVVTIKHSQGECTRPIQKLCKILDDPERTRPAGQDVRDSNGDAAY